MPEAAYMSLSVLVVLLWFPISTTLTERFESLEIIFYNIQALGVYGSFAIKWPAPLGDIFSYCAFFNIGECRTLAH